MHPFGAERQTHSAVKRCDAVNLPVIIANVYALNCFVVNVRCTMRMARGTSGNLSSTA